MKEHRYESFRTDVDRFEASVNDFIERKLSSQWVVRRCSYRNEETADQAWISCLFERDVPLNPS